MDAEITGYCCVCDDFLKSADHQDDPQCHMSTAEIMTTALTAAAFFSGCHKAACNFLKKYGHIPEIISKVRFSRRFAAIPESIWRGLADWLASAAHNLNLLRFYIANSFPVPICKNIRIKRCKIYQEECFRGHMSSRKEYFYGM